MRNKKALAGRCHPGSGNPGWRAPIILLACVHLATLATLAVAADDSGWLTGPRLDRQLQTQIQSLQWGSNPLRNALGSLARSQRTAIFLDRRVDPDQLVNFSVQNEPLKDVLQRLAHSLRFGACRVGPVVYLGPAETASVLGAVVESRRSEIRRWPAPLSTRLLGTQPVNWPELAEPRDLITRLAEQSGIEIHGLDQVPHDLWPAADLPPLDFAEHLSLLLVGFGLTFEPSQSGPQVRLTPLPTARQAPSQTERWTRGEKTTPSKRPPATAGQVRYTLEVKNQPVGAVAQALAERLELQIEYDPQIRDRLQDLVSFRVEEVTREALLHALFRPAELTYQIAGDTLTVLPASDDGN